MKKKLCTMAVSLMVGLSLMACGGNAKQAETGKESEAGTTAAAEEKGSDSSERAPEKLSYILPTPIARLQQ